jgi:hypothetical protein
MMPRFPCVISRCIYPCHRTLNIMSFLAFLNLKVWRKRVTFPKQLAKPVWNRRDPTRWPPCKVGIAGWWMWCSRCENTILFYLREFRMHGQRRLWSDHTRQGTNSLECLRARLYCCEPAERRFATTTRHHTHSPALRSNANNTAFRTSFCRNSHSIVFVCFAVTSLHSRVQSEF